MTLEVSSEVEDAYVKFCANPLRDEVMVRNEFLQLVRQPDLRGLAFRNPHTMMLATPLITLFHPYYHTTHNIGEFIIYVIRARFKRSWGVDIRFENISGALLGNSYYIHPHITIHDQCVYGIPNAGEACIERGRFSILQHIRKGEIHKAFPLLIELLNSYNDGDPCLQLENWPERKPND